MHQQDPVSNPILSNYCCTGSESALLSISDGNCLFNSISLLLVGNESLSIELRYRSCCIEMVTNKSKIRLHGMNKNLELLSPDYDEECLNCTQPGNWSSAWMILSLSNLLNFHIKSVFPAIDGSTSHMFKTLKYLFRPTFSDPKKGTLFILWTNTVPLERSGSAKEEDRLKDWGPTILYLLWPKQGESSTNHHHLAVQNRICLWKIAFSCIS